jgi:hypothetical protein
MTIPSKFRNRVSALYMAISPLQRTGCAKLFRRVRAGINDDRSECL